MDHIIPLKQFDDDRLANDWYRMHVLLSHRLGPRVDDQGNANWTFSPHPEHADLQAVIVRTSEPRAEAAAKAFAPASIETYVPAAGESVNFSIVCSGRVGRPGTRQTIEERLTRHNGVDLRASKIMGRYDAHLERVEGLLTNAGLTDIEVVDLDDARYFIRKNYHHAKHGIGIVGIRAIGTAKVSDADALSTAVRQGIGRDKAFGFGVPVIAPLERKDIAA